MKNYKFYLQQIQNPLKVNKKKNDVIKWCHDFIAIFPLTMLQKIPEIAKNTS